MFSESTQKQLLLISGILGAVGGIIGGVGTIIGAFKNITGLPPWVSGFVFAAIFIFGAWMLIKWRTRHSRLLKPDALRLDRDNAEHLVGRAEDINNLLQLCVAKQVVFLEGESGSGKSALVRSGLLPKLKNEKSLLPLLLNDLWVDDWERSPFKALKSALINSNAVAAGRLSTLADVEQELTRLNDQETRTPLIIFDQFDDYQARNRERFLPNKTWLDAATLRQSNPFWDMVARLLQQEKLRCLFVTRSDTAAGLGSVEFLGPVQAFRLDRVSSPYIAELLMRLTEGNVAGPVIADPDAGWNRLRDRVIRDLSEQDVILPQQLKIMLGGIQSLKWLNIAQYERAGGATGIEAFYVEQQISGTARKVGLDASQVRALLVMLIDPMNPTKTRACFEDDLLAAASKMTGQRVTHDKLDNALEELERSEMVRSPSDPESGRIVYRLDHDYLARGVSTAQRQANRWHYLLEDGAKAFQNAGTLWKKWNALLPVGTQCRLALERARGRLRYGSRRSYALLSLVRFPVRLLAPVLFALVFITVFLGVFVGWFNRPLVQIMESRAAVMRLKATAAFPGVVQSTTDPNQISSLTGEFEGNLDLVKQEDQQLLAGRIIETMQRTTNSDQMNALVEAFAAIEANLATREILKPEEAQTLADSILPKIQSTTDAIQLSGLTRAFAAILPLVKPENARALAPPIIEAIKGGHNSNQRHALGLALAAAATQMKPEEAEALDSTIAEAIKDADGQTTKLTAPATALGDALNQGSKALSQSPHAKGSAPPRTHSRH